MTDAMLALGFIDAERYPGGRFRLQPALARQALQDTLNRTPFG